MIQSIPTLLLNLPADARRYDMCSIMLDHLQAKEVKLLTNNPLKPSITDLGINVVERVPLTGVVIHSMSII